jgi:hypothetical protein
MENCISSKIKEETIMSTDNKNEVILTKLALILPSLPDEGKDKLLARIEGMGDVIESITATDPRPPKATA